MKELSETEHKERHMKLHGALDELVADFVTHTTNLLSKATLMELIQWSHEQTKEPTP